MTTTAWTETPTNYCTCDDSDCGALHADVHILPERFAFWVKGQKRATYYATAALENFQIELTDLTAEQPFATGEAIVRDLATGAEMDAAEWMAH